jgi:hypothetical protein
MEQKVGDGFYGLHTNKSRQKISMGTKGKKKPPFTEEHRKNMSLAKKGKVPWNKGKKATPEAIKNQSLAHIGIKMPPRTEQHCKNISIAKTGSKYKNTFL